MERTYNENWTIDKLIKNSNLIEFPEFQREPKVWKLDKKQRLIDSIFRGFDISSIYFYKRSDGKFDCIDGQQRINAIWSYMQINDQDSDNGFHTNIVNEVYEDKPEMQEAHQKRYSFLSEELKEKIKNYELNVVLLTNVEDEDELNLQFLRLQLGAPLRGGEKLNAMKGDMRDFVFNKQEHSIIKFDYFTNIAIRRSRYASQEVAAQILLNAFSKKEDGEFHRSRFIDLQEFFKKKENFSTIDKRIIDEVKNVLNKISECFGENLSIINNKAIAVSTFLFVDELMELGREDDVASFKNFLIKFLKTKDWQIPRGLDMDLEYRDILNFQTRLTQAAGEKTAIQKRHDFWREYFTYFKETGKIKGDDEYQASTGKDPDIERAAI